MLLRVRCQICGGTGEIDTKKKVGPDPRWEDYSLRNLLNDEGIWRDMVIWICPSCHDVAIVNWIKETDEEGEYWTAEWDWERLITMVRESLGIKEEECCK